MDAAGRRRGVDIISVDRPGIGQSGHWNMSSIAQWPQTVEHVADQLGIGRFAMAGWSGGGPYALACAAAMPARVRAVATIAGIAPLEGPRHVIELGLWADRLLIPIARWCPHAAAAALWPARHVPEWLYGWQIARGTGTRDRRALEPMTRWLIAANREATSSGVSGMVDEYRRYYGPWGFDLGDVRQSVTVWHGKEDTWVPMSHARRLARSLPHCTLRVVPSTGHLLPLVVADQILEELAP